MKRILVTTQNVNKLALEFSKVLYKWLGTIQMEEINSINKKAKYKGCATGDYCDSNQAMIDAWEKLWGKCEYSATKVWMGNLMDKAWEVAKINSFYSSKFDK